MRQRVDDVVLVSEGDIEHAIVLLLEIEKTVVEGAGAAGLAALIRHKTRFAGKKVGIILCGGNIDPMVLADIIERGMVRAGRLVRIRVACRDVPGELARAATIVGSAGANIEEVNHQRAFTTLPAQNASWRWCCRPADRAHRACAPGAEGSGAAGGGGSVLTFAKVVAAPARCSSAARGRKPRPRRRLRG